jgi:hypothetical protein
VPIAVLVGPALLVLLVRSVVVGLAVAVVVVAGFAVLPLGWTLDEIVVPGLVGFWSSAGPVTCGNWTSRGGVSGWIKPIVEVGDVDVAVSGLVRSRQLDGGVAAISWTGDSDLGASNVELGAAKCL